MVRERGPAAELHRRSADLLNDGAALAAGPVARLLEATDVALVLGSHQDASLFEPERASAAGVEIVRRRSGGSAVLVGPGRVLWVDILIGRGDPRWDDDVSRAAWWVGALWAAAVGPGAEVWRGPMLTSEWSPLVCFAGLGPGEVTVAGRKVVGLCQRRTPGAALFQTAALLEWRPGDYIDLVARAPADPSILERVAAPAGPADRLERAFLDALLA